MLAQTKNKVQRLPHLAVKVVMAKILVADDETSIRVLCYELFTRSGHEVITVPRGDQALSMLATEKPDLVLLDIHIPGESGLSLLKKMRERNPRLPLVVFSGFVTAELEKQAFEAGAVEVVQKGIEISALRDKILKVLEAKNRLFGDTAAGKREEKILVVDDEEPVRRLLVEFFSRKGFSVQAAKNGEEAVQMVEKIKPSVVLLDMRMPGMDGLVTLKKIREIAPEVGVVMATAVQDEEIAKEASALGAYHYVLKPFDLQYLELVVLTRLAIAS